MAGVTPNNIRYPDGASKAKNLGPELQQMAEDIDRFIDDQIDANSPSFQAAAQAAAVPAVAAEIADAGLLAAVPKDEPARSGRTALPVAFRERTKNVFYPSVYPSIYPAATWADVGRRRTDVPALRPDGTVHPDQVLSAEVQQWIATALDQYNSIRRVVIIAALGQSNGVSHGQPVVGLLDSVSTRIFQIPDGGTDLIPAAVPLTTPGRTATGLSPAHVLAREIAREDPSAVIVIVPAAKGGSGLVTDPAMGYGKWAIDYAGANQRLYQNARTMMNAALAAKNARWGTLPTEVITTWNQGEADGADGITRAAYETELDRLIVDWRGYYGGIFLIAGMVPQSLGTGTRSDIQLGLQDTPRRLERVAYVPGVDNGGGSRGPGDVIHYGREAVEIIGRAWYSRGIPWAANNVAGAHTQPPVTVRASRWAGEVAVEWEHPYCRVTAFEVQSSTDGLAWTTHAVAEPVATNLTFPSAEPVKVRVRAIGTETTNWTVPVIAAAA